MTTSTPSIAGSFFSANPPTLKKLCYTQPDEGEETHALKDNRGRCYRLDVFREMGPCFFVRHGGCKVAEALCETSGTTLILLDFQVQDDLPTFESWWSKLVRRALGRPRPRRTCRRRGLGTALLQFIVAWAGRQGFTEIRGSLSPRDLREFSNLKGWYRNNGFSILPGGQFGVGELCFVLPDSGEA